MFDGVPLEIVPWSRESEYDLMRSFDVGIMPLPDSPWEQGKCGFKLIQYMACGLPVVASPVGVNSSLVEVGINGFLASSNAEWVLALGKLREDLSLRIAMGAAGRRKVEDRYCSQIMAPKLLTLLTNTVSKSANYQGVRN